MPSEQNYGYAVALTLVIGIVGFCLGPSVVAFLLISAILGLVCRHWLFRPALNVVIAEPLAYQEGADQGKQRPILVADAKRHAVRAAQDGQTRLEGRT